jgi:hypothetical protein
MRLAVLDASPVGGGPVTHAVACAAAQVPDAAVTRIRMFDVFGRVCATCTVCAHTGRCTRRHPVIDEAVARLSSSDALILGTSGHLHARDPRCRALLERLVGAFGHVDTARGLCAAGPAGPSGRRAALVCAAPPLLGIPAMLGLLPAGGAGVWRVLEDSGTTVVGCASVSARWAGPASRDRTSEAACRLGRRLAAAGTPASKGVRARPMRARVAAAVMTAAHPM